MNLAEFRSQTKLLLGNLPDEHPIMALRDQWINSAIRDFPQRTIPGAFDRRTLFPELTRQTLVQPAANQAWIMTPVNMLAPLEIFVYRDEAVPNLDFAQGFPVTRQDWDVYQVMNKDASNDNWTQIYSWFDDRFYLWPTPISGKLGWLLIFYLFEQPDLTLPEHVPLIDKRWHRAITFLATAYGEAAQNHKERAAFFEGEANKAVGLAMNWIGMHDQRDGWGIEIHGDINSMEVYD